MFLTIAIMILVASVGVSAVMIGIKMFKEKGKTSLDSSFLWKIYLYVMVLVSLMLFIFGGYRFTKAMFAKALGIQFSYSTSIYQPAQPTIEDRNGKSEPVMIDTIETGDEGIIEYQGEKYVYSANQYKADMIDGLTMFVSLLLIYAIHRFLILKADTDKNSFLKKAFNFTGLAQYGILSVVAIPIGVYDVIKYLTEDLNLASYNRALPGASLAVLIFVVPAWIVFLARMAKENNKKK